MARTLEELAELAQVSRSTVSRVLNGGSVKAETRARVLAVLESTGYRPNVAARNLASGRSGVVGVVMHEAPGVLFHDPYFSLLFRGIGDALADQAVGMMLWLGNRTKEETLSRILRSHLDGVVVTANNLSDSLVDGLLASNFPAVLIGHRRADRTASYVDVDHVSAADAMTSHLIGLGRARIGHISGPRWTVAGEDRHAGWLRAMRRAGLPTQGLAEEGDYTEASGYAAASSLIGKGVDALFCANDRTAAGAMEAIRHAGRRVPDDIAVAGFDDLEFAARLDPPLTTVRQGVEDQGREAAHTLLQLLTDPAGGPRRVLLPTELVIRQSTVGGGSAS